MINLLNFKPLVAAVILHFSCVALAAEQAGAPVNYVAEGGVTIVSDGDIRRVEMAGPVRVTQGSIVIEGDAATFEYSAESGRLMRAIVDGSPVRYQQELAEAGNLISEPEEADRITGAEEGNRITGSSDRLILFEDGNTFETMIEMIGNASINTPDANMSCVALLYNSTQRLIPESTGPCGGSLGNTGNQDQNADVGTSDTRGNSLGSTGSQNRTEPPC